MRWRNAVLDTVQSWVTAGLCMIGLLVVLIAVHHPEDWKPQADAPGATSPCFPTEANNWCAPPPTTAVKRTLARLQSAGFTCDRKAILTNTILFQYKHRLARIVTFDEAYRLGEHGRGWVQAYCTKGIR